MLQNYETSLQNTTVLLMSGAIVILFIIFIVDFYGTPLMKACGFGAECLTCWCKVQVRSLTSQIIGCQVAVF